MSIYKEDKTIETLLARIKGEWKPKKTREGKIRKDIIGMYNESVPEPNGSKILGFYRSLVTEELGVGRIGVLVGNIYRISIWLKHRPFEELTKDDIVDLIEQIRNLKFKRHAKKPSGKATVRRQLRATK